jgi:adenosylmethionine-8-amino-7-oxononanoate aminotransferase
VGAAAALACLAETERLNLPANAAARGAELFAGLQALGAQCVICGDVRGGEGLMCALELVSDPDAKTPIDKATINKVQRVAYEAGAMVRVSGPNIILSPPLVIGSDDVQVILSALKAGFQAL